MRHIWSVSKVAALLLLLGAGGWYFANWAVRATVDAAMQHDLEPLSGVVKATVGETLARGDQKLNLGSPQPKGAVEIGAIDFYRNNPDQLKRGRQYFDTWYSALLVADASAAEHRALDQWEGASNLLTVSELQRRDGWGHEFCVMRGSERIEVISSGPGALGGLNCDTIHVSDKELAQMPTGQLHEDRSGALILVVRPPAKK